MKSFFKSFLYAIQGVWSALNVQRNIKVQLTIAVVVILAGFYLSITDVEWCILLLCIALVIGLELVNTALENLVDLVTQERHPLAGRVKDIAAGAVLFASVVTLVIGIIIFKKYLL